MHTGHDIVGLFMWFPTTADVCDALSKHPDTSFSLTAIVPTPNASENVTVEQSEIWCFSNHASLLQWLKVKQQDYTGFCIAVATLTVSGWCPGNHLLLFPFVLHRSMHFAAHWLDLWWSMCHLKIDIMVFSPFSASQVKQKEGVFACLFLKKNKSESVNLKWSSE